MAYPVFAPTFHDDNLAVEPKEKILESDFGEYVQRAKIGLNSQTTDINPAWTNMYASEANYIITFLRAQGRTLPFWYTAANEPNRLYVCDSFSYKWKKGKRCDISAKFIETRVP